MYTRTAERYDFTNDRSQRYDIQFYVDSCQHVSGEVLELACGTGRILLPIARSGVTITGVDLYASMLVNVVGTIDLLYAVTVGVLNRATAYMGAAYWIPAALVPALLVSHALIFLLLFKPKGAMKV